ncbi:AAA domain-containing protein [Paenibacillus sp. MBLB4367]|uniref:AAA domain-containing protein n=1 Tax=Paenibacillus sp. MBLB4367 TaxID=3384767 RepID=UPI00390803C5
MIIGNRYEPISRLDNGRGSRSSKVWIAKDLRNKSQLVTLKQLSLNVDTELKTDIKELFQRETDALSKLKHPNIISFIESGIENETLYIVTERFDGQNLKDYVTNNQLSVDDVLKVFLGILYGISEAHKNNIVHRDLKPSNILVGNNGEVKIIDFGISKILGRAYDHNETLKDYMTTSYASPEQLLRSDVRVESDIFSLGAVLYYLITNKDPVPNKELFHSQVQQMNCEEVIKSLIIEMTRSDYTKRPVSVHTVIRQAKTLYIQLVSQKRNYYIKMPNYATRQLYELGIIDYSGLDHALRFISNDLSSSSIYLHKNNYYLIGKTGRVKYQCKISQDKYHLVLNKVVFLDDYIEFEKEYNRGIELESHWTVVKENQQIPMSDELQELLESVNEEEKKRQVRMNREENENKLLSRWNSYLEEEFLMIQKKKRVCIYESFEVNISDYTLEAIVENHDYIFEKNDLIQMSSKNNEKITVGTLEGIENNKIIINIGLNIMDDLESIAPRGVLGIDVVQAETSLRRLRRAARAIKLGNTVNPNLKDILHDPQIVSINNLGPLGELFQNLDDSNLSAVESALATKDVFLIQGPPGTGKTTVITEIVCQILRSEPNARILLTSQSHVAVDHAIKNISKLLPDKKIIRVGRSDKISHESESLLMANQLNNWVTDVKQKSKTALEDYLQRSLMLNEEDISRELEQLDRPLNEFNKDEVDLEMAFLSSEARQMKSLVKVTKEWHLRLGKLEEFDEIFAQKASIIAATCLGIASRHALSDLSFDWVIVDEAARATAPELLVPIVKGKKIILVGDHKQLPPVINGNIDKEIIQEHGFRKSDLEKSLFEDLFEKISDESKIVLQSQFRMHPTIAKLISDVFYPEADIKTKKKPEEREHSLKWWPKAIVWLDTQNHPNNIEQEVKPSKRNNAEAQMILKCLDEIERKYSEVGKKITVGVITGYDAQKSLLNNLVKPYDIDKWKSINIVINNVDAFQGSETDIAIYSIVRNNQDNKLGFLSDSRRLNVALSRGKTCLIIVGNARFVERAEVIGNNPFVDILQYIRRNTDGTVVEEL